MLSSRGCIVECLYDFQQSCLMTGIGQMHNLEKNGIEKIICSICVIFMNK